VWGLGGNYFSCGIMSGLVDKKKHIFINNQQQLVCVLDTG
jgi:hypothetical protein